MSQARSAGNPSKPKRAKKKATEANPLKTKSAKAAATGGQGCDGKGKGTQAPMPENKRPRSEGVKNVLAPASGSGGGGGVSEAGSARKEAKEPAHRLTADQYAELEKRHKGLYGVFQPCAKKYCPLCY